MDLNRILAASYDGDLAIIEPKANGDWMYVLGCSAPCSLAEERMGHYMHCQSITVDMGGRSLAVVVLDVRYKDGKDTRTMQVALKVGRQEGHAYVDLENRSSRILKRVVHVVGPYEMRVRLPVGEPYNGEWFSTMTDADAEQWRRAGRGCRYIDPVTACRYLAEEIDEAELLAIAEGESPADKLARLEKENAGLRKTVEMQGVFARSREDDYRLAVSWMKRLWIASGGDRSSFGTMDEELWLDMWERNLGERLHQRDRYADKLESVCRFLELLEEQLARRWFTGDIRESIAKERHALTVLVYRDNTGR